MKKQPEEDITGMTSLRDKIVGLSESLGRRSYYPMLQQMIRELQNEIAERNQAEDTLRKTLQRIERQQAVIAEISKHPDVFNGRLEEAAPMMTAKMAHSMGVERASLWVMRSDKLYCLDKFETRQDVHSSGNCLECGNYRTYFEAIKKGPIIAVDARQDPRTKDFLANYPDSENISSILDVPVLIDAEMVAVICFEHTEEPRAWQPDEITFSSRIADQVALILARQRRSVAEEKLQNTHAILKRNLHFTEVLLDAIPIPIFYMDSKRRYLGCNLNFTEIMGVTCEEIRGKTAHDFWPEMADLYNEQDACLRQDVYKLTYESKIRNKDGEMREVILAKQIFFDEFHNTEGTIGSFVDITERNRTAKETQRLRNLLSNIVNSMPSMLIGVDDDGRIELWNQQAELLTGVSEQEAQGQQFGIILPWLESKTKKIRQTIASKKQYFEGKTSRIEQGNLLYEDITIFPIITNDKEGAVIRIDNVTDKVRIEEILIQSEKMLSIGGLAAGMAHEINNPLASIMGNAQVIESRLLLPIPPNVTAALESGITLESLHRYLEKRGIPKMLASLRSSGAHAAKIVSNMLSFSRKSESVLIPENITELLDNTLELACADYNLKNQYDFKKIQIVREYESELPKIHCSATELQQVFLNLLRNGSEAMCEKDYPTGDGPRFTLRASRKKSYLRIEFEDNGPGLEESVRKRIFEPFYTTKSVGKGTGLGLSVSYFIITEEHGGIMSVQTSFGKWTRFIIDLPVERSTDI
ncbi:PAS domain S-box protein [Desulfomicrobium sp. ZS1]|uniref:PAS domain S-box protein n=1 Tax=Desulfomicrobium sp. ZS1 TaxID=2952228 RepID=UPI0020B17FD3|nr:PAS domain S-box protein [Desulfomicrobium sp. ZS1]UTF51843.1 PAS domain S-box protein [Desulfomicrobium sp. ZS1]